MWKKRDNVSPLRISVRAICRSANYCKIIHGDSFDAELLILLAHPPRHERRNIRIPRQRTTDAIEIMYRVIPSAVEYRFPVSPRPVYFIQTSFALMIENVIPLVLSTDDTSSKDTPDYTSAYKNIPIARYLNATASHATARHRVVVLICQSGTVVCVRVRNNVALHLSRSRAADDADGKDGVASEC